MYVADSIDVNFLPDVTIQIHVKNKEGPQNPRRERRWLRPKEAAVLLDCHVQTIYSALLRGDLPGAKIKGIGWRLDWLELERRIESQIQERQKAEK